MKRKEKGKRFALAALALLACLRVGAALAELPQSVVALCAAAHPGYETAAQAGWGDENAGQFALVLTDGQDNILCIAEKAEGDAAYALTVDNTNAVREGAQIPSLFIDTGGDVLFYSYWDDGLYKSTYHSAKQNGEWGRVQLQYQDTSWQDYDVETWVGVDSNHLFCDVRSYDKLENPTDDVSIEYMDIPVSQAFADSFNLASFDIGTLSPDPGLIAPWPGLCAPLLEEGDTLFALNVQEDALIMLVQKADGSKRLRIADGGDAFPNGYAVVETGPLPEDAAIDTWHGSARETIHLIAFGGDIFNFSKDGSGKWVFTSVQAQEGFSVSYDAVRSWESSGFLRNDGTVYGASPWNGDITQFDLTALPRTFEEAVAQLDTDCYAVVHNPNPADRLHLRTQPDKNAASAGKFYNNTPVYILGMEGEWAHVRIGSETDGREGYMMKKFLAFGADKEKVECAFPQKFILPNAEGEAEIGLKQSPAKDAQQTRTISGSGNWYIVGVAGDDWYVVMTDDGAVGYVLQGAFWDGNG